MIKKKKWPPKAMKSEHYPPAKIPGRKVETHWTIEQRAAEVILGFSAEVIFSKGPLKTKVVDKNAKGYAENAVKDLTHRGQWLERRGFKEVVDDPRAKVRAEMRSDAVWTHAAQAQIAKNKIIKVSRQHGPESRQCNEAKAEYSALKKDILVLAAIGVKEKVVEKLRNGEPIAHKDVAGLWHKAWGEALLELGKERKKQPLPDFTKRTSR